MSKYNTRKALLPSLLLIIVVILIHKLPLNLIFLNIDFNNYHSEAYDKIITSFILIAALFFLIRKMELPFKLFSFNFRNILYYLPLVFYIMVFSGGFKDFFNFDFSTITFQTFLAYTLKYFSSSFLEEFVFRGFILGGFLLYFPLTRRGILTSVVLSGLIFGLMHIINLWTFEERTVKGVLNQVYAATCFGIMYGATYLKTRSILTLGLLHFLSSFFSSITELNFSETISQSAVVLDPSLVTTILSEIFKLIIFGIPLIIGLLLITFTDQDDIIKLKANKVE